MTRGILLDANTVIAAFDPGNTTSSEQILAAKAKVRAWMEDDDIALAVSPLITYEVLRGVSQLRESERWQELKDVLAKFDNFDIDRETGEAAANLFQLARDCNYSVDKRGFDILHVATAHCQNLEFDSADKNMPALGKLLAKDYSA